MSLLFGGGVFGWPENQIKLAHEINVNIILCLIILSLNPNISSNSKNGVNKYKNIKLLKLNHVQFV